MKGRSRAGVDDALDDFCRAHGQALIDFAFLLTGGQGTLAEDLVQGVLTTLVRRGLDGLDNPAAYARRGVVNAFHSHGRHTAVERKVHPRLVAGARHTDEGPSTEDRLTMLAALETLTERERVAVVLRYYEDLPDDAIAEVLECSRPTVRSLVHRALPKLREHLRGTYGSGAAVNGQPDGSDEHA